MAEQKQMRLSLAARKLNVGLGTIVEHLAVKGEKIDSSPNAKLTFGQLEILAKDFDLPELTGKSTPAVNVPAPRATEKVADDEILYFRNDTPKVAETSKKPEEEKIPERIVLDNKLSGTRILGKIDLGKKPAKPTPKPVEEIKTVEPVPTPAPIPAPPAPVAEEKPKKEVLPPPPVVEQPTAKLEPKAVEKTVEPEKVAPVEKKEEAPKVVEEKTVVKAETPKQPEIEKPKEEKKEPEAKKEPVAETPVTKPEIPVAETKKEADVSPVANADTKPAENPVNEIMKGTGHKLQGLKVLGKIELPSRDSGNRKKRKRKRVVKQVVDKPQTTTPSTTAKVDPKKKPDDNRRGRKGNRRDSVSQSDVKDNIKQTMARIQGNKGPDFGAKNRRDKRRNRADRQDLQDRIEEYENSILKVTEFISASELASLMDVSVNEVIATCMQMGMFVSINQRLDAEAIQMIGLEFDFDVEFISAEDEVNAENLDIEDAPEDLKERGPIVTIMGHVDHGKTSLLDYIRTAKVASGEAGGITQHVGAYSVTLTEGSNKGKKITFLDTPGHEAFTAMRARGAKVTDVVIIVVAADDSVMPQTREAINHAQNAGVPIIIAINKIDKPGANPEKIRQDLSVENILVESWGGKYQDQEVSAKHGTGIDDLLDKIILEAEVLELKANPNRTADGTVVEASLDKGRGYVSDVLVQSGTLKVGDVILAGQYYGKVRAMIDDLGNRIEEAGPATPVQILGLPGAPQAGDRFNVMPSEREAREIANKREQIIREQSIRAKKHITLDEIGRRKAIGSFQELNVIVKGDVDGSVEALSDSLLKLSTDEIQVRIIHKGVGPISESDVLLASAADAIVIGFQVRPSLNARKLAENEEIEIRLYSIIYDAINELKDALEGMLAPKEEEVIVGNVEVREVFKISRIGTIAGCYVLDGYIKRSSKIRIIRDGIVNHEGEISELKRFKDNASEVKSGYECGLSIKNFNNIEIGDIVEVFETREIKRKL
ncbi:MAG: translation initiation factor IF-2 [Spirosomataceae bacterium]|jgi:translation initiation factor IF-2